MPTYEYRCPSGHITEKFAKISEATAQIQCAVCGAVAERQISGGAGLVFKGSGFYLTDYGRSGSRAEKSKSDAGKEGKSESSGDGKQDGKADSDSKSTAATAKPETTTPAAKKDSASTSAAKPSPKKE
jgi:putative FmdB family regulatory protein